MKTFTLDDDMYIARVLRGLEPSYSPLDDVALIKSHLKIIKIYKSINADNIDKFETKGTPEETRLYEALKKIDESVSLEYTFEIAVCAFNANLGITARNIASLLSMRLIYTISGFYEYQIEGKAENYFNDGELITRERIDDFSKYVLSLNDLEARKRTSEVIGMNLPVSDRRREYIQIDLFQEAEK
ncbi:hypothetical protein N1E17_04735 [Lacticaseibacillus paracasei]